MVLIDLKGLEEGGVTLKSTYIGKIVKTANGERFGNLRILEEHERWAGYSIFIKNDARADIMQYCRSDLVCDLLGTTIIKIF